MTNNLTTDITRTELSPFGLLVQGPADGADLREIPPTVLENWTVEAKVLVLRGFPLLSKDELIEYGHRWGEILTWDFGEVLDLVIHEDPNNYLFTRGDVPFHWDGAFAKATPRFFLFQCVSAPKAGGGGETVFSDTTEVIRRADERTRQRWDSVEMTYHTEQLQHYGGNVTAPLTDTHPVTGKPIIRYAEPLPADRYLNPLSVEAGGVPEQEAPDFLTDLRDRLHADDVCYHHEWQDGDIVVVDNNALVHGRNAFRGNSSRHLQRMQII
ncbi:MAG TPA: TauD/TfdA family dioxygenase [Actinophytocola sp.]|nr:TauD/TfdA family dioxygenase [Actinophytocola sp.]